MSVLMGLSTHSNQNMPKIDTMGFQIHSNQNMPKIGTMKFQTHGHSEDQYHLQHEKRW